MSKKRFLRSLLATILAPTLLVLAGVPGPSVASAAPRNAYTVTNLVSDVPGLAPNLDPNLINAWGLVAGPTSPWWVADNEPSVSTLYTGDGTPLPLIVLVAGNPTGTVFNGGPNFVVTNGSDSGPAVFMFATESGTILGWNPAVPPPPFSTQAFVVADRSGVGAKYKGLAIASTPGGDFIYATDFHNARVDVFDGAFNLVTTPGAFVDPKLPSGFAPFGIREIGGVLFVTYAKQDADHQDDVGGQGHGFVDMFDTGGAFLGRVATRGQLNSPWGLALAPAGFGRFGGDLLVGNFGDGHINAYALKHGAYHHRGELRGPGGEKLAIDGLWAIAFGNDGPAGPSGTLFFTAGPDHESHGLFGTIEAAS
jgi:uncharacterized protein (TIGR03118 family)